MIEGVAYILLGLVIGLLVGWLFFKLQLNGKVSVAVAEKDRLYSELDKQFAGYKAAAEQKEATHTQQLGQKDNELVALRDELKAEQTKTTAAGKSLATATAERDAQKSQLDTANGDLASTKQKLEEETKTLREKEQALATAAAERDALQKQLATATNEVTDLQTKLAAETKLLRGTEKELVTASADLKAANEKLDTQKIEIQNLQTTMQEKFKNIASEVLDEKSKKFTETNEKNIKALIEPLGRDIREFKEKVTEESKQRFSLGEKVKELVDANKATNEVAVNLTKALKGEAKTQGNWGEMILESILEKSGLRKNEQYFMQHQLLGEDGKPLRSESEDKKMLPDAVIKYPDERHVIVDSKVSLTAYARAVDATEDEERMEALAAHVASLKGHIDSLSAKGYEDYNKSLDFVLMFVPSEAAYSAALQSYPDLWNYAYDKRILLQSPTNLITSLKMIKELWKREARNQNAEAIAELGAKIYDKLTGFVETYEEVGKHLVKAKGKYDEALGQLKTGRGNVISQAGKLKLKVVSSKKSLPDSMLLDAFQSDELTNPEEANG